MRCLQRDVGTVGASCYRNIGPRVSLSPRMSQVSQLNDSRRMNVSAPPNNPQLTDNRGNHALLVQASMGTPTDLIAVVDTTHAEHASVMSDPAKQLAT